MFVGIGFLSLLTAVVAFRFVKQERGAEHEELMETLRRIEADEAELKSRARCRTDARDKASALLRAAGPPSDVRREHAGPIHVFLL